MKHIAWICPFFLLSCNISLQKPPVSRNLYFNIQDGLQSLLQDFSAAHMQLRKTVYLNGDSSSNVLDSIPEKDLSLFAGLDLNKPAWQNKFSVDTIQNNTACIISYHALSRDVTLRSVTLTFNGRCDTLQKLDASEDMNNTLFSLHKTYSFDRRHGYSVHGVIHVHLSHMSDYGTEAVFIHD